MEAVVPEPKDSESLRSFFTDFMDESGNYTYKEQIEALITRGKRSLIINFDDLLRFDPDLAKKLLKSPDLFIQTFEKDFRQLIESMDPEYAAKVDRFHLRFRKVPAKENLRDIRAKHIGKIIEIEGILTRVTEIKPLLIEAVFRCVYCKGDLMVIPQKEGRFNPPEKCLNPECGRKGGIILLPEESTFIDWQRISIQEKPEELPPGRMPQSLSLILYDDLVDIARPGDRIIATGILRSRPEKALKPGKVATFYRYIECNFLERVESELETQEITPTEEKQIQELGKDPWIAQKIVNSIAPSIYGYDYIKEALALLLFGGITKHLPDKTTIRGEPNILLIGDPGTGKSQILKYIATIAPRGLYTSGKGSTAAGLTAAVIKDPMTGELNLEAGALVLCDKGIACIDEFDKMRPDDRVAIHEAMEQHSYHPTFEITLSDGRKVPIGSYVENLFNSHANKIIKGINCEILPTRELKEEIHTCDFDKFFPIQINQVSRHEAPPFFIKIRYSNGRKILVTPDHPIFIFNNGYIDEIPAESVVAGSFVPAARNLEFHGNDMLDTNVELGREKTRLPAKMEVALAKFLGFFASVGYLYQGSSIEIGLRNTDPEIASAMKNAIFEAFDVNSIDNIAKRRTIRIISKSLYNYMLTNFPELIKKSRNKRVPKQIFVADKEAKITFLNAAFLGDGTIESEALAYSTLSKALAEDYQDLLLSLGVQTSINSSKYITRSIKIRRKRYKVYIRGESLEPFVEMVIPELKYHKKIAELLKRRRRAKRDHDVLPPSVGNLIKSCMKKLGIPYNGYFQQHLKENYGITIKVVDNYLNQINQKINKLEWELPKAKSIQQLRQVTGYSQESIARLTNNKRSTIDYIERRGYVLEIRADILTKAKHAVLEVISEVRKTVAYIQKLKQFRWLRVKNIETVENSGKNGAKWAYDVTVYPTMNFVSHGLILHNTISIAKAGIVATLNARAAIVAAANPKFGRYNPYKDPADNINLPTTVLSRFDLIFIMQDKPDPKEDRQKARHILKLHERRRDIEPPIPPEQLRKYISYAKQNIHPSMTTEAAERIEEFYMDMRTTDRPDSPIAITPRQLEGLVRLAEARARMRLNPEVAVEDAETAIRLVNSSLKEVGMDTETGAIDALTLMTGRSQRSRSVMERIMDIIKEMSKEVEGNQVKIQDVINKALEEGINEAVARDTIQKLKNEGDLYEPRVGYIRPP
ncbi:MAG: LAGLIDADG family homing endonuclease [Candidatus Heimdallarchaeota archaeon]